MLTLVIRIWLASLSPEQCVATVNATIAPDMTDDQSELTDEYSSACDQW